MRCIEIITHDFKSYKRWKAQKKCTRFVALFLFSGGGAEHGESNRNREHNRSIRE